MEQGAEDETTGSFFQAARAVIKTTVSELESESLLGMLMCGVCCDPEQLETRGGNIIGKSVWQVEDATANEWGVESRGVPP
jgi:hypothetical protein